MEIKDIIIIGSTVSAIVLLGIYFQSNNVSFPTEKKINYIGTITIDNRTETPNYFINRIDSFIFRFVPTCSKEVERGNGISDCGGWVDESEFPTGYPSSSIVPIYIVTKITIQQISDVCNHEIYHTFSPNREYFGSNLHTTETSIQADHEFLARTLGTPQYPDYPVCRKLIDCMNSHNPEMSRGENFGCS